jgi:hypothetical protein
LLRFMRRRRSVNRFVFLLIRARTLSYEQLHTRPSVINIIVCVLISFLWCVIKRLIDIVNTWTRIIWNYSYCHFLLIETQFFVRCMKWFSNIFNACDLKYSSRRFTQNLYTWYLITKLTDDGRFPCLSNLRALLHIIALLINITNECVTNDNNTAFMELCSYNPICVKGKVSEYFNFLIWPSSIHEYIIIN